MSELIARTIRAPASGGRRAAPEPRRRPRSPRARSPPRPRAARSSPPARRPARSGSWTSIECSPRCASRSTMNGGPSADDRGREVGVDLDVAERRRPRPRRPRRDAVEPAARWFVPRRTTVGASPSADRPCASAGLAGDRPTPAAATTPGVGEPGVRDEEPHGRSGSSARRLEPGQVGRGREQLVHEIGELAGRPRVERARHGWPADRPDVAAAHRRSRSPPRSRGRRPDRPAIDPPARRDRPRPARARSRPGSRGARRAAGRSPAQRVSSSRAPARCRRRRTAGRPHDRSRPRAAASPAASAGRRASGRPGRTGSRATASRGPASRRSSRSAPGARRRRRCGRG